MPAPKSAVMMISSEKPGVPSGMLGGDHADRLSGEEVRDRELQRAGILAPVAGSKNRYPPPLTRPPSMARPTPTGGLNEVSMSAGPEIARFETHHAPDADASSTTARSGPSCARRTAPASK